MAYCVETDVEGLTGLDIGTGTQPSTSELAQIMTNISAEIDGVLRAAGYDAPITSGTNDLALLKHYATLGSGYTAWHATIRSTEKFYNVESWETDYRNFLSRLRRGEQMLIDNLPTKATTTSSFIGLTRTDAYTDTANEYS